MYEKTVWKDHVVERPNTYSVIQNQDGTKSITPAAGTVLQQGTPLNATNLNKMEQGIADAHEGLSDKLDTTGGTITGSLTVEDGIDSGGEKITNVGAPESSTDAANKAYVDGARLIFTDVTVQTTAFVADTTYADFGFKADIALSGVTESMIPDVIFPVVSFGYAPVCDSYNGGVRVYVDNVPEENVKFPAIILLRR